VAESKESILLPEPEKFDLTTFDPFSSEVGRCPFDAFETLRSSEPVFKVPDAPLYLISSYEHAQQIALDTTNFSLEFHGSVAAAEVIGWHSEDAEVKEIFANAQPFVESLHNVDPPDHTRQRRSVTSRFSPGRINRDWTPLVEQHVDILLDQIPVDTDFEFMSEVAIPLPIRVIAAILGIPLDREADYKRWSDAYVAMVGRKLSTEEWLDKARNQVDMQSFFSRELDDRRNAPTDDLLTDLLGATKEEPPSLSDLELLDVPQHFLVAGNETTTQLLGEMMRFLAAQPHLFEQIRRQPELIPNVVEEALRLASPVLGNYRVCVADTEVGGVVIPAGALVSLLWGGANHDPHVFENPEMFVPDRANANRHLAFGKGMHFCLGAPLAKLEAKVALTKIVERYSSVSIFEDSIVEDTRSFMLRGLRSLHVRFTA